MDLASGNELSSLRTPHAMVLQGWNSHGIWFSEKSGRAAGPFVWKPGQSAPQRFAIPGFDQNLASVPGSDRLVVTTRAGDYRTSCARVVELQPSGTFRTARESCTHDVKFNNPVLSPDGRYLVIAGRGIAVEVDSGREISLKNLPEPDWRDLVGSAFEDATHVLLLAHDPDRATPPVAPMTVKRDGRTVTRLAQTTLAVVYRCDVVSGNCSAVYRAPAPGITLPHP